MDEGRNDTTAGSGGRGPDGRASGRPGDGPASIWTPVAALVVLLAVGGVGLYLGLSADDEGSGSDAVRAGDAASASRESPDAPAKAVPFPTLEGDTASLEDYRGEVVVFNVWGTWCPPCREEIPDLVELQDRIEPRGGTVIGLAVDSGSPSSIRDFAEQFGMNYPIWHGSGREVVSHYRVRGYPTTLLIDREGVVRERHLGPQTAESLMESLEPLLSEG